MWHPWQIAAGILVGYELKRRDAEREPLLHVEVRGDQLAEAIAELERQGLEVVGVKRIR
ncbi:MAG TPA: hypothetical protein VFK89_11275 [Actinomycetota bacterium]|nr:hypothetical protein [Actinomycetota bacterium]